jgi:hypothetical protein
MKAKLTLSIDANVIEKAKTKASLQKTSLSALIEEYLDKITLSTNKSSKKKTITDTIKAITKPVKLSDIDYKKEWHKHLDEKYGK